MNKPKPYVSAETSMFRWEGLTKQPMVDPVAIRCDFVPKDSDLRFWPPRGKVRWIHFDAASGGCECVTYPPVLHDRAAVERAMQGAYRRSAPGWVLVPLAELAEEFLSES